MSCFPSLLCAELIFVNYLSIFDKNYLHFDNDNVIMMSTSILSGGMTTMNQSTKPSNNLWFNLTLATCGVLFICCLMGDIFGYAFCDLCWTAGRLSEPYMHALTFLQDSHVRFLVFLTCFYLCTLLAYPILFCVVGLLRNLKKDKVFDKANTRFMSIISLCCFLITLICFIAAFACYTLILVSLVGLFVGLIVQCVRLVMDKAIDMRSELDLTV